MSTVERRSEIFIKMVKLLICLLIVSVVLIDGVRIFPLPERSIASEANVVKPTIQPTYKTSQSKYTSVTNITNNALPAFTRIYKPISGAVSSPSRDLQPPKVCR